MKRTQTSVYSWPAIERMMRIHRLIENKEYPNCSKIAKEFEMSEADTFALFIASKAIEQYRGTPLQKMMEATFRKLTGQLDQSVRFSLGSLDGVLSFRPFAPGDAELKTFQLLTRAVSERRKVTFLYRNRGQVKAQQRRNVHPYHIACVENQWCMFGFDPARNDIRTFVLVRLSKPRLGQGRFEVSKKFDLNEFLRGSLGLFKGTEDFEVVVDLDAFAADDVRGRRLHSSQELTELPKGMLRVRLRLNSLEEVEGGILGFGKPATVVGPEELRERGRRIADGLAEKYRT